MYLKHLQGSAFAMRNVSNKFRLQAFQWCGFWESFRKKRKTPIQASQTQAFGKLHEIA